MEREKEQWNSNTKEAIDTRVRYEKMHDWKNWNSWVIYQGQFIFKDEAERAEKSSTIISI